VGVVVTIRRTGTSEYQYYINKQLKWKGFTISQLFKKFISVYGNPEIRYCVPEPDDSSSCPHILSLFHQMKAKYNLNNNVHVNITSKSGTVPKARI
jgi:hypothetical protein